MTHPALPPVIRAAWYQPNRRQLDLMFGTGRTYRYAGVPAEVAQRFAAAQAKGRFYNQEIRGQFPCTQIDIELDEVA